jgi:hypothetical protein
LAFGENPGKALREEVEAQTIAFSMSTLAPFIRISPSLSFIIDGFLLKKPEQAEDPG